MLTVTRRLAAIMAVAGMLLACPTPTWAGDGVGGVDCTTNPRPGCSVAAGTPGSPPHHANRPATPSRPTSCRKPGGQVIPCERDDAWAGGDGCYYKPTRPSPSTIAALGGQPPGEGGWYQRTCYDKAGKAEVAVGGPVWLRSPPVTSPQMVARQAVSKLTLPSVSIVVSPSAEQLVGLPTWLALDGRSWTAQSATAAVPHVRVTATARPVTAVWDMGDGSAPVVCHGPGTVWRPGMDPSAKSPDCGYVYHHSSAASGTFTIRVSVSWRVSWRGTDRAGTVPGLTTVGSRRVRVAESQAVVTG